MFSLFHTFREEFCTDVFRFLGWRALFNFVPNGANHVCWVDYRLQRALVIRLKMPMEFHFGSYPVGLIELLTSIHLRQFRCASAHHVRIREA